MNNNEKDSNYNEDRSAKKRNFGLSNTDGQSQSRSATSISPATQARQLIDDQFKIMATLKEQRNGSNFSVFNRVKETSQTSNFAALAVNNFNQRENTHRAGKVANVDNDNSNFNSTADNYRRDGTKFSTPNEREH